MGLKSGKQERKKAIMRNTWYQFNVNVLIVFVVTRVGLSGHEVGHGHRVVSRDHRHHQQHSVRNMNMDWESHD